MDSLIDPTSRTWNLQVMRTLVDSLDAKIIKSIPLSWIQMEDQDGWPFTSNEKYTVKSGYHVE